MEHEGYRKRNGTDSKHVLHVLLHLQDNVLPFKSMLNAVCKPNDINSGLMQTNVLNAWCSL